MADIFFPCFHFPFCFTGLGESSIWQCWFPPVVQWEGKGILFHWCWDLFLSPCLGGGKMCVKQPWVGSGMHVKVPPASTSGRKLWGPLQCVPQGLEISGDLRCLFHWRWEGRWAIVDTDFQTLLFEPKGHGDSRFPKWLRLRPFSLVVVSLLRHHKANSNRLQSNTLSWTQAGPIKLLFPENLSPTATFFFFFLPPVWVLILILIIPRIKTIKRKASFLAPLRKRGALNFIFN